MNKRELGLLEITAVIGAIASIFGVWTWFGSAQERRENEEIRRVELVDRAKTILEAESEDGIFENSTNVNWAFRTLARYEQYKNRGLAGHKRNVCLRPQRE